MNNNINNISLPEGSLNNDLNIRSRPLQFRRQRSLSETSDSTVVPSSFAREVANSGSNGKKLAHGSTLFSSSSSSIYSSSARVLSSSASHIPSLQYQQNPNSSLHSRGSGFLNTSPSSTSPQTTTLNANAIVAKDARVDNQSQSSSNGSSNNNNGSIQQASPIRASNGPSNSDNKNNTLINRTTRQSVDSQQSLSPKTLQAILVTLQLLSLVPAFIGVCYCLYRAIFLISLPISRVDSDEAAKLQNFTEKHENQKSWNKRIEWLLCAMWAALSGNYCHSMARGLTRRWLVYYPLPAAVIRLVSLQVICWPLTKFTVVNFFGKDDLQLPAWIVCAVTAAISNTIQIWVTSNLRFLLVSGASSHPASWASRLPAAHRRSPTPPSSNAAAVAATGTATSTSIGIGMKDPDGLSNHSISSGYILPRGLRSKQVIRQTVLPFATCSFATLLWALVEVYSVRGSRLEILNNSGLT